MRRVRHVLRGPKAGLSEPVHSESILVIGGYPLGAEFAQKLTELAPGDVTSMSLSQLRLLDPLSAIRKIRSQTARRCFVAIEDASGYPLRPILQLAAVISRAQRIDVVHPDLRIERVSRARSVSSFLGVLVASVDGAIARRRHSIGIRQIGGSGRVSVQLPSTGAVLYVNPNLWFGLRVGGAVTHITGVVNALVDLGYHVDVASLAPLPLRSGAKNLPVKPPRQFAFPEDSNYFRFQSQLFSQLRRFVSTNDYEFIYQRMSVHNYVGVLLSRATSLPLILEYNGSEAWAARNWGRPLSSEDLAMRAEEICLRHAHLVVTVSEVLRREVIQRGVDPARVITCPNGFDPNVFDPERFSAEDVARCRDSLRIPRDAIVATFVGTFGAWHGVEVLARLIRRLVRDQPAWFRKVQMRFLLIGDGAKMGLVRSILGAECASVVVLPGLLPRDAVPVHLAASQILLAPHTGNADGTEFFGSPTKLFEYMAMGRAIVASSLGQIAQILAPSLSVSDLGRPPAHSADYLGILVAPGNDGDLESAIRFLAESPTWAADLGAAARRRALEAHTWHSQVQAILSALRALGPRL